MFYHDSIVIEKCRYNFVTLPLERLLKFFSKSDKLQHYPKDFLQEIDTLFGY